MGRRRRVLRARPRPRDDPGAPRRAPNGEAPRDVVAGIAADADRWRRPRRARPPDLPGPAPAAAGAPADARRQADDGQRGRGARAVPRPRARRARDVAPRRREDPRRRRQARAEAGRRRPAAARPALAAQAGLRHAGLGVVPRRRSATQLETALERLGDPRARRGSTAAPSPTCCDSTAPAAPSARSSSGTCSTSAPGSTTGSPSGSRSPHEAARARRLPHEPARRAAPSGGCSAGGPLRWSCRRPRPQLDDEAVRRLGGIALADLRDDEKADPGAPVLVAGVEVDPERPWQPAPGATGLSAFTLHYHAWLVPLAAGGEEARRRAWSALSDWLAAFPPTRAALDLAWHPYVVSTRVRAWSALLAAEPAARPLARAGAGPVAGARARRGPPGARRGRQPPAAQRDGARGRRGPLRRRGRAHAPARSRAARAAPAPGPVPARRQPRRALDGVPGGGGQRPPGRVRSEPRPAGDRARGERRRGRHRLARPRLAGVPAPPRAQRRPARAGAVDREPAGARRRTGAGAVPRPARQDRTALRRAGRRAHAPAGRLRPAVAARPALPRARRQPRHPRDGRRRPGHRRARHRHLRGGARPRVVALDRRALDRRARPDGTRARSSAPSARAGSRTRRSSTAAAAARWPATTARAARSSPPRGASTPTARRRGRSGTPPPRRPAPWPASTCRPARWSSWTGWARACASTASRSTSRSATRPPSRSRRRRTPSRWSASCRPRRSTSRFAGEALETRIRAARGVGAPSPRARTVTLGRVPRGSRLLDLCLVLVTGIAVGLAIAARCWSSSDARVDGRALHAGTHRTRRDACTPSRGSSPTTTCRSCCTARRTRRTAGWRASSGTTAPGRRSRPTRACYVTLFVDGRPVASRAARRPHRASNESRPGGARVGRARSGADRCTLRGPRRACRRGLRDPPGARRSIRSPTACS